MTKKREKHLIGELQKASDFRDLPSLDAFFRRLFVEYSGEWMTAP